MKRQILISNVKSMVDSYSHFLQKIRQSCDVHLPISDEIANLYHTKSFSLAANSDIIYLIDYVNYKYRLLLSHTHTIFGYPLAYILEIGPQFFFEVCHPSDLEIIDKCIFPEIFHHLQKATGGAGESLNFSTTYRIKNKVGQVRQIHQRSSFFTKDDRVPIAALGIINDITHYKASDNIALIIEDIFDDSKRSVNYYYPGTASESLPSKREVEVLKWVSEGFSSKQIAAKMNISLNTVNNHRKNLLEKTGCKNISEVLIYSIKHGLL